MRRRLFTATMTTDDTTVVITRVWRFETEIDGWSLGDQAESFTFPLNAVAAWSDVWETTRQKLYPPVWVDVPIEALP